MTGDIQRPLRLGVLLSGGGRTLMNLQDEIDADRLDATVAVVIASRECKGIDRAKNRGLDVELVPYKDYGHDKLQPYSDRIAATLDHYGVDLVVMAGFLSKWLIPDRYAGRVMNIHPALLPKFGGEGFWGHHVHEAVLQAGEEESGCTVHYVTNDYDAGPIILQRTVPVLEDDTPDTLADRVFEQECIAYPEAIRRFAAQHRRGAAAS